MNMGAGVFSCPSPCPCPCPKGEAVQRFDREKLDVYQAAVEFVALADDVVENLPRGRAYLADQLQRPRRRSR
jgi:hypothetical protein